MSDASMPAAGDDRPLVIVLLGPTASGKTALGIELAQALDLAVLSVDSRQLYQGMEIGTAKPTPAQRAAVRHELLELRRPDQPINLQEFRVEAEQAIAAEHARRGMALLVGGSGLYLKAITQGMTPPAVPPQPQLRAQLDALGQPLCHQLLVSADPVAGARIMANDAVRTQRALEVVYATGAPLSSQQGATPPPWRVLELGLNPPDLKQRIAQRSAQLFADGLVEETRGLVERYGADCPLLDTIGYGEAKAVLRGELRDVEAIALTTRRTQQFAKRQRTWFRRQHQPIWLDGGNALQHALPAIERVLG
jgi:tRNA dimethylallyltransferase